MHIQNLQLFTQLEIKGTLTLKLKGTLLLPVQLRIKANKTLNKGLLGGKFHFLVSLRWKCSNWSSQDILYLCVLFVYVFENLAFALLFLRVNSLDLGYSLPDSLMEQSFVS